MLRRDYILRMIEEFREALARIQARKSAGRWDQVEGELHAEFQRLFGSDAKSVTSLSENELLARLMQEGPTQALWNRTLMAATLLQEAGDLATRENRLVDGRDCYLKALHLLLHTLARGEAFEAPEFVPKVATLLHALQPDPLPPRTQARLMQHCERIGDYAKAEDALYALLESDPENPAIVELGSAFYQRLLAKTDRALVEGNLPRSEVEDGLRDLRRRIAGKRVT